MIDPRPSKADPEHRAARKALEKEHGYDNLKSMGLKAGVLAMMAGLALYPKISAEADVIEREMKMKAEKKIAFKKREKTRQREDDEDRRERRRRRSSFAGERERGYAGSHHGSGSDWRPERETGLVRVADEAGRSRDDGERYERKRGRSVDERRRAHDRRWEGGSMRSAGSDRTRDWLDGGYEYLNDSDYRESDRRRW